MIKEAIGKVVGGENLTQQEAYETMSEIMSGKASEAQIASFITALRMKGETIDEITGCARVMREFATHVEMKSNESAIVDTCGTGGDGLKTFNISTISAFVIAGCGVLVAKHGNRAVSSSCGSADLLEALGVKLELTKEQAEECLAKTGIVFLFAPVWHTAMKYAIGPRKQIGIRTIFNILGPLSNPALASCQVLGVYDKKLIKPLCTALKNVGVKHAFVVHGNDGLDEITITGKTTVNELVNGKIKSYTICPSDFGIKRAKLKDIYGGDIEQNKNILISVLSGQQGPKRDIVLLNAAAAFVCAGKAKNLKEGIELARKSIDSGAAMKKVEELKKFTQNLPPSP